MSSLNGCVAGKSESTSANGFGFSFFEHCRGEILENGFLVVLSVSNRSISVFAIVDVELGGRLFFGSVAID
jgi:hypothetical protein